MAANQAEIKIVIDTDEAHKALELLNEQIEGLSGGLESLPQPAQVAQRSVRQVTQAMRETATAAQNTSVSTTQVGASAVGMSAKVGPAAGAISNLSAALTSAVPAMGGFNLATKATTSSLSGLSSVMSVFGGPVGIAITAVTALAGVMGTLVMRSREAKESIDEVGEASEGLVGVAEGIATSLSDGYETLSARMSRVQAQSREYLATLQEINAETAAILAYPAIRRAGGDVTTLVGLRDLERVAVGERDRLRAERAEAWARDEARSRRRLLGASQQVAADAHIIRETSRLISDLDSIIEAARRRIGAMSDLQRVEEEYESLRVSGVSRADEGLLSTDDIQSFRTVLLAAVGRSVNEEFSGAELQRMASLTASELTGESVEYLQDLLARARVQIAKHAPEGERITLSQTIDHLETTLAQFHARAATLNERRDAEDARRAEAAAQERARFEAAEHEIQLHDIRTISSAYERLVASLQAAERQSDGTAISLRDFDGAINEVQRDILVGIRDGDDVSGLERQLQFLEIAQDSQRSLVDSADNLSRALSDAAARWLSAAREQARRTHDASTSLTRIRAEELRGRFSSMSQEDLAATADLIPPAFTPDLESFDRELLDIRREIVLAQQESNDARVQELELMREAVEAQRELAEAYTIPVQAQQQMQMQVLEQTQQMWNNMLQQGLTASLSISANALGNALARVETSYEEFLGQLLSSYGSTMLSIGSGLMFVPGMQAKAAGMMSTGAAMLTLGATFGALGAKRGGGVNTMTTRPQGASTTEDRTITERTTTNFYGTDLQTTREVERRAGSMARNAERRR